MKFTDGVEQALLKRDLPIITYYDFFVLGHSLFQQREWDGEPLKCMPQGWDQTRANNAIKRMEEVKKFLTTSENQLRLANNKLEDVSVKKLTRKNPTMKAKFEALKGE